MIENPPPLITNDAVVLGILMTILGLIFITSSEKPFFKSFGIVPSVLLCYFIPALFNTFNIISGVFQSIHHCISLLITCEFSTTYLEYQFCCIKKLGSKAIIMAGTLGIIIGGPFALYIVGSSILK
jgi:uncharacterized membrane protein